MKYLLFFVFILILVACQFRQVPLQLPDEYLGYVSVSDTWEAYVEQSEISVIRQIELDTELTDLINGSQEIDPSKVKERLITNGASQADCQSDQFFGKLNLKCEYHFLLERSDKKNVLQVDLPDASLLGFLAEIPRQTAIGIEIEEIGTLDVPGVITSLPSIQKRNYEDGSFLSRRFTYTMPSRVGVSGEIHLPPGSEGNALTETPGMIGFDQNYILRPSAWLAFGTAFLSLLFSMVIIFPVGTRLPLQPNLWKPNFNHIPFYLLWFFRLVVRLLNWLRQNWPRLLNLSTALIKILFGIQVLDLAWNIASIYDQAEQINKVYEYLAIQFPWLGGFEFLLWTGWPILLALLGLVSILTGVGLLTRQDLSRYVVASMGIIVLIGMIYLWPKLLLTPPFIPFQTSIVLWMGELLLAMAVLLARGFTHSQFRRYFVSSGEE